MDNLDAGQIGGDSSPSADVAAESNGATGGLPGGQESSQAVDSPDTQQAESSTQGTDAAYPSLVDEEGNEITPPVDLNFETLKKGYVALERDHRLLKKQSSGLETLEPWRPVTEKFTSPDEALTYAELGRSLFTPLEKDGQTVLDPETGVPQTTALPFILNVFKQSPEQGTKLLADAMDIRLQTPDGRVDTAFNLRLQELGLDPSKIEQYAEWGRTGAPVAQSGVDLSNVPQQFHEAVKALPAKIQEDISNLANADVPDEELLKYYLNDAQAKFDDRREKADARATQQREAQATVERNTQTAVQGKLETGVDQFLEHLSEWKPTADDEVNRTYHLETASSLLNLLDPGMAKINNMLYQTLKMQPDADIPKLNEQFQQQTRLAEHYKSVGETFKSADALRSADSAYMRLVAKLNGVAGKLIEHKSRVAKLQEQAAAADGQSGRIGVTGQPGAIPQNGRGGSGWTKAWYD